MAQEQQVRGHRRFNVSLPLWVRFWERLWGKVDPRSKTQQNKLEEEEQTITTNISSGGCFFYVSQKPSLGASATILVDIPARVSGVRGGKVLCKGKVVRVSDQEIQGKVGVACTIDSYVFKPHGQK